MIKSFTACKKYTTRKNNGFLSGFFVLINLISKYTYKNKFFISILNKIYRIIYPMDFDIKTVQKLVGNITYNHLKDVDTFVSDKIALFIPSTGPCKYAVTEDHSHPGYSFILTFDNNCKVKIDGKMIESGPGKLTAFSPGVQHHEIQTDDFCRYIAVMIDKDFFEEQAKDYSPENLPVFRADVFNPTGELKTYLKDFMIEYQNKLPGYEKILDSLGLTITHAIIRILLKKDTSKQEVGARIDIGNLIEFMHSNYDKKLTIDDLSRHISLSPSHFSRLFKNETGKSPLDYLIHLRLDKAKKMLLNSNKNITEIALDTGFNSSSHFSSTFIKYLNISPSDYKKKYLKK